MRSHLLGLFLLAAPAGAVPYTSFEGDSYDLTPWIGDALVVLTLDAGRDPAVMGRIVDTFDDAWAIYAEMTGREPVPFRTYDGKASIAEVEGTCGAGCAYVGLTGIEILAPYFDLLYDGVALRDEWDQIAFYEMGRNYWFYSDPLKGLDGFLTGFAIANRFVSMREAGLAGGPYGPWDFETFREIATDEVIAAYLADPTLDWSNTLAANAGVPGTFFSGAADLGGALLWRIYEENGIADYGAFWQELGAMETAEDPEAAMGALIDAAYLATGTDYRPLLKATDLPSPIPLPPALPPMLAGLAAMGLLRRR